MFTVFDCLHVLAVLAGIAAGVVGGAHVLGPAGMVVGAAVGLAAGYAVGGLPFALSLAGVRRGLRHSDAAELGARVEEQYVIAHLLIEELARRGEPLAGLEAPLLRLLRSDAVDRRSFGWACVQRWFPELARRLEGFDPHGLAEARQAKLRVLEGSSSSSREGAP